MKMRCQKPKNTESEVNNYINFNATMDTHGAEARHACRRYVGGFFISYRWD